jgi:tripartite-type tricarboxylate transporter receptor subunit TctC
MFIRKLPAICAGFALISAFASPAARAAQGTDWPAKPVTILAPFAAGGTVDLVARVLAVKLQRELGQPFVVDNRGGAGGTIATAMLARAAPDGYTLMVHHMGLVFSDSLYRRLPYNTKRDILPVAYVGATPNVLVVTNSLPVRTMSDFLTLAKAKPGAINYGSGGVGSAGHLPMAVLGMMTGTTLQHVPYKGSGPALTELVSGQIQSMLLTIPAVMPFINSGMVRPIATSGKKRSPALPNLPTLEETGIKGFEYAPWYGFFAPAGTPPAVVQKLYDAVEKALQDKEVVAKLAHEGVEVEAMPREQFVGIVDADMVRWRKTIAQLGIKQQ